MADRDDEEPQNPTTTTAQIPQKVKKRRLHGSCDTCRKKKIKCDSANMPNNHCTNCISFNIPCEHTVPRQKKKRINHAPPQNNTTYIQNLQERLEKLEKLLQDKQDGQNGQDKDTLEGTASRSTAEDLSFTASRKSPFSSDPGTSPSPSAIPAAISTGRRLSQSSDDSRDSTDPEDLAHLALADYLAQLSIKNIDDKFFGKSSVFMFARHASAIRSEVTGAPLKPDPAMFRRPIYWDLQPWEAEFASSSRPTFVYPEPDLLISLTNLYFDNMNLLFPLLHRPTFMKSIMAGQHLWDNSFGMTVLIVCAIGARYSPDARVLLPEDAFGHGFSAGWKYFIQTQIFPNSLFYETTLYNLQYFCLAVIYLTATSVVPAAWNILGLGLRYAIEKSAHRRACHSQKPSANSELMKRAFWCMMCIDRLKASFLGRPPLLHQEDFDADYPIECDDEYWETEDPEQAFKQPEGKPCKISSFVYLIKLCEILATSMKLYATKKPKNVEGMSLEDWERGQVAQLDSLMNKWKNALPSYLIWNQEIQDPSFFHQSVLLHATYYYVQIVIHQPFITKQTKLAFASLAQCTNASRSCVHVLEIAAARGIRPTHHLIVAAFASGIVVVLNIWGHERSGITIDVAKEMQDLRRCMTIFMECEKRRWIAGGRLRDLLTEVASLNGKSLAHHAASLGMIPYQELTPYEDRQSAPTSFAPTGQPAQGIFVPNTSTTNLAGDGLLHSTAVFDSKNEAGPSFNDFASIDFSNSGIGYNFSNLPRSEPELYPVVYPHNPELPIDMISLFSDMPAAFSVDDWDTYLRSR